MLTSGEDKWALTRPSGFEWSVVILGLGYLQVGLEIGLESPETAYVGPWVEPEMHERAQNFCKPLFWIKYEAY